MSPKKIIFKILALTLLAGVASSCSCSSTNDNPDDPVKFIIDTSLNIDPNGSSFVFNYNDVDYEFGYAGLSIGESTIDFAKDGYLETLSPIKGLEKLTIDAVGSYQISYGYEKGVYDFTSKAFLNNHTYIFNDDRPSFFKVSFLEASNVNYFSIEFSNEQHDNPFKKIPSISEIPMEGHEYNTKATVDFPSFPVSEGLSYHLSDDGTYYIVDNYNDELVVDEYHRIVFPSEHNGLPVKRIGKPGILERLWIWEIYIPESITSIENECFSMCGLKKVYWDAVNCSDFPARNGIFHPSEVQDIELIIGPHVKHVPARMMLPSMMTPNIHSNVNKISFAHNPIVESIGDYAFYGQSSLTRIDIPDTVTSIGEYAFYGWGMQELELENVKSIGGSAFRFNKNLVNVKLPNCLETIGDSIFEGCSNIKELDLSTTSITNIPFAAFKDCSFLTHIRFPNQLLTVGDSAFLGCEKLNELVLPASTKEIGPKAFENCSSLIFIELNKNLKNIYEVAFYGCKEVKNLVIKSESISDFKLNNKTFIEFGMSGVDVYVDPGVQRLPANMFFGTSLTTRLAKINNIYFYNPTIIGDNAFFGLEGTNAIYFGFNSDVASFQIGANNDILNPIYAREE